MTDFERRAKARARLIIWLDKNRHTGNNFVPYSRAIATHAVILSTQVNAILGE